MPKLQVTGASRDVHATGNALRGRLAGLVHTGGSTSEWRRLKYDAVCALVEAQRKLVASHLEWIAVLRADRMLYRQQRTESLQLALGCDSIRDLIRDMELGLDLAAASPDAASTS